MNENQQKEQFQECLPFYVNDRLAEADRVWMQRYIDEHPEAKLELQVEYNLKSVLTNELPEFAHDKGLGEFMARLRTETDKEAKPKILSSCKQRLQQWKTGFGTFMPEPRWAMAMLVIIAQAGWLGVLLSQRQLPQTEQSEWRSVGGATQYSGPVLQITFKPSTTEEDMRLLLVKIRGTVLGGPGQLGHYFVKVPEGSLNEAQQQVQGSPIIESVQLLQEMPPVN